jgi:putative peptidoglycan lipid II flippase
VKGIEAMGRWSDEDRYRTPPPPDPESGQGAGYPPHGTRTAPGDHRTSFWTASPPQDNLWYPAIPEDEAPEARAARREAYAEAVDATRYNMPALNTSFLGLSGVEQLIPPRRGRVQGPGTRPGQPDVWSPDTPGEERPAAEETGAAARSSVSRASRIMALGTIASRVTGMMRQLMLTAALGLGALGTSFNVANNVPNTIYLLVIGGAVNSIFVPQLVRAMKDDADGGKAFMDRLLTLSAVVLTILTVVCVFFAPQIVSFYAGGFSGSERELAIVFARYCLPQIFFYGLFVMLGQILNAKDKFGPMMWTPVLANVIMIATLGGYLWIAGSAQTTVTLASQPDEVRLLGVGTTLGIVVQTLTLFPYLRSVGVRFRPRFDWRGTGLGKSMTMAKWTIGMVLVGQVSTWVVTYFGSAMDNRFKDAGVGYTAYSNALTIWILPQAVITVSIITALLPRMSRAAHAGDRDAVRESLSYGLRVTAVAIVPCAFVFLAFGQQISAILFGRGGVTPVMAHNLGYMLMAFGLGLIPFSAQYLMLRGFYAYEDTKTPFVIAAWISAINSILSLLSYALLHTTPWAVTGMCVAYVISYSVGLFITARRLSRKLRGVDGTRVMHTHIKLGIASAVAAAVGGPVAFEVTKALPGGTAAALISFAAGGSLFAVLFLALARKMRIEEVASLLGTVRARFGR